MDNILQQRYFDEIFRIINNLEKKLNPLITETNKTRVILLGPPGSGKSTFLHLISDCHLRIILNEYSQPCMVCDGKCRANYIDIGLDPLKTLVSDPDILDNSNLFFCDFPHFFHYNNLFQRIIYNYTIQKLLTPPCNVKILLFLRQSFFNCSKGQQAIEFLTEVNQFFTNFNKIEQCVGLVITSGKEHSEVREFFTRFAINNPNNHLIQFLANHYENIFQIPKPSPEDNGKSYLFRDKDRILHFLNYKFLINTKLSVISDQDTIQVLNKLYLKQKENICDCLIEFSNDLSERYKNVTNIDKLNSLNYKYKQLRNSATQGISNLCNTIRDYKESKYIEKIELFVIIDLLFSQLIPNNSKSPNNDSFDCSFFVEILDEQIEILQNKCKQHENINKLYEDQNDITIEVNHPIENPNQINNQDNEDQNQINDQDTEQLLNSSNDNLSPEKMIQKIEELNENLEHIFDEHNSSKTRVLFLGPTGCGKTTLMHLLSGCQMKPLHGDVGIILECNGVCLAKEMKIGHTAKAETSYPSLMDNSKFILCDCPGFLDNRSLIQRVLNSFSIEKLLTPPCKIKILLFISQYHFQQDRGSPALKLLDEAENFFKNYEQIEQCFGLVVTHLDHDIDIIKMLEKFKKFTGHRLLNFFIKNPEKCFRVYKPIINAQYKLEDKDKILNFLKKGEVENPEHNIIIDNETIQNLFLTCNQMNDQLNTYLTEFAHDLSEKYRSINNIDEINLWIEKIEELRKSASKSFENLLLTISKHKEFDYIQKKFKKFVSWNHIYNQLIKKSSISISNMFLFDCHEIIKSFDDQIEELKNRRNSSEQKIQLVRDDNVTSITNKLDQIIKTGGVVPNQQYNFFEFLSNHPFHFFTEVYTFDYIEVEVVEKIGEEYMLCKMTNNSLRLLINQMEIILRNSLCTFKFIKNGPSEIDSVLDAIRTTDISPVEIKIFKKYKPTNGNKVAGGLLIAINPYKLITGIPIGMSNAIKPALKKEKDKKNVVKMNQLYFDNTYLKKVQVFEMFLCPMLETYRTFYRLFKQGFSIDFKFGREGFTGFPFYDAHLILPNDFHLSIISLCQKMSEKLLKANDENSYEVFSSIYSLYKRICGEIDQLAINVCGSQLCNSITRGEKIDNILQTLMDNLRKLEKNTNDEIVQYSQVVATTRMIGAIYGRGNGSHERKDLFGLKTTVNCQNESGTVRVYSRQNIQDINNSLIIHVLDMVRSLENLSDSKIGDFDPDSFAKTTRDYFKKIENEYEQSKLDLNDSIQSIFNKLGSFLNISEKKEIDNKDKEEGKKLLNDLENVEGVVVEKKKKNKAIIKLKGSTFKVFIGHLLDFAPLISKAVFSTQKKQKLKEKTKLINSYLPLLTFYEHTTGALQNLQVHGVVVEIHHKKVISIEDITLYQ